MAPNEIRRIRTKLDINEKLFSELFGLSGPAVVADIENGSVKPAGIIITMLTLLDSQSPVDAKFLIEQILEASRKNSK